MKKNNLLGLYDQEYAEGYNEKFLTNPFSRVSSEFEHAVLKTLIHADAAWLDAGCGTGYFLGLFPGIRRAGLDISPSMLEQARKANPDALFFREGDFRADISEWHGQWSLVSCMWYPYSYLESIAEVEEAIQNMIKWVKHGGDIFIPVADLTDLRPGASPVEYKKFESVYGGTIAITGYTWTWTESEQKNHLNMVAPHVEHVITLLEPFFETIEVLRYPPAHEGWVSRRAILGRRRRAPGDIGKAVITCHPVPAAAYPNQQAPKAAPTPNNPAAQASSRQLIFEVFKRIVDGHFAGSVLRKLRSLHKRRE